MAIRMVQVGMGVRGTQWAGVVRRHPHVENVAYVRPELEIAQRQVIEWGEPGVPCFTDLEAAIQATHPDAVLLVTPPEVHHEEASLAFQYGCHVLCEKPLSEDFTETVDMVRRADAANRLLMAGMNFRYLATSQKIRQMIAERALGQPGYATFTYLRNRDGRRPDLNKYPLTMPQPFLLEQAIHHLDLLRYCYQDEVRAVKAETWRPAWSTYADDCCTSALLEFRSGLRVTYTGAWTSGWNRFCFEWRTDCSGGILIQKDQFDDLYAANLTPGLAMTGQLFKTEPTVEPLQRVPLAPCRPFLDDTYGLLDEFTGALDGGQPLVTSGKDHLRSLGLVMACIASSHSGERIELDSFLLKQDIPASWIE